MAMFEQSDGTQWTFLSGLAIGLAGNLLINGFGPQPPPNNAGHLIIAGVCFVVSSACFSIVGWILQQFEYAARTQDSTKPGMAVEVKRRLVRAAVRRLLTVTILGISFSVGGMLVLITQQTKRGECELRSDRIVHCSAPLSGCDRWGVDSFGMGHAANSFLL
jgi:drug/metabolite transporter (DMT)-like permease